MTTSCPVPTPAEKQYGEVQQRIELDMMSTIYGALRKASEQASRELQAIDIDVPPPAHEYFISLAHQKLFLLLCGADTETFEGGDPEIATYLIQNGQNIRDHYSVKQSETAPESL